MKERTFFPLTRKNFILMAAAGLAIVLGFLLMLGSGSTDEAFNKDIFSARRVVIGPTICFLGYIFMGVAIMWNPRKVKGTTATDVKDDGLA